MKIKNVTSIDPRKLLTFESAAKRRGKARTGIHSLVQRDKIPVVEIDGRYFIDIDDLDAYNPLENKGGRPPKAVNDNFVTEYRNSLPDDSDSEKNISLLINSILTE